MQFYHEIAICFKQSEYTLLGKELLDLDQIAKIYPKEKNFKKHNQAMVVLLGHHKSKETIVVGNAHMHYSPLLDHVKFA